MRNDLKRFEQFIKEYKEYQKITTGEEYSPAIEKFEFKRYLTDIKNINDIFKNEFNKNQKFLAVAPTNSGKTFTLINYIKQTENEVYLFTVPNKSQSEQIEQSYPGIISIVGEKNYLKDFNLNDNRFFSIVYDKMNEIETVIDSYPNLKFNIVLDESHNLESSVNYRPGAIQSLDRVCDLIIERGGSVCLMTASFESMKYERIDKILYFYNEEEYKAHTDNFNLYINKCFDKDKDFNVFSYNLLKDKKGIVRYNSKESTDLLESALKNKDGLLVYHTNGEDRKYKKVEGKMVFDNIIDNSIINFSKLPLNDLVFTTCKFDCGTNISEIEGINNYDYESFFLVNNSLNMNLMNIEQFFNRLRFHNKCYNLFLQYEKQNDEFKTLNEIAKEEKKNIDRNIKYLELLIEALKFRYNNDKNKIIEEFNYQLNFEDKEGNKNDLGCIYLNDNLEVKFDRKEFFNKCNNKYQRQYFYNIDKLVKKIEEIFNIKINIKSFVNNEIEYVDLEAFKDETYRNILKQILEDNKLLEEIKTNNIKSDIIKDISKKDIYKNNVLVLNNLGFELEEALSFVIENNTETIKDKKKELIKGIELSDKDILALYKLIKDELTLKDIKDIDVVNYKNIYNIYKSEYYQYIVKSVKMKIDIKEIWEVIKNSQKDSEINKFFLNYQTIYYNKLFLEDERLLGGKIGKEQKLIIKFFLDKYNKVRRIELNDKNLSKLSKKLNDEFKTDKYTNLKVKNLVKKIFNINKENQTTSLKLK